MAEPSIATDGTEYLLRAERLSRQYPDGNVTALVDVSLGIRPGEYVSIMGPSGSGKSTLLNLLGALDTPTSGEVYFEGQPLSSLPSLDEVRSQKIGYVFQSSALFPHLSVEENVRFGAPSADLASTWLERLRLSALAKRRPSSLSGGEAQRVALARALARQPKVLLLDEPFSSLDDARRDELLLEVKSVVEREQLVTVFVTHDRAEGERLGGTFVPMNAGRVNR